MEVAILYEDDIYSIVWFLYTELSDDFDKHSKEEKAKAKEARFNISVGGLKFPIWTEDKISCPGNRADMKIG